MIFIMLDKSRIEKAASVLFALALWQVGAMLLDKSLILVTPIVVVQRLFSLCTEVDFLSSMAFFYKLFRLSLALPVEAFCLCGGKISPCGGYVLALYGRGQVSAIGVIYHSVFNLAQF